MHNNNCMYIKRHVNKGANKGFGINSIYMYLKNKVQQLLTTTHLIVFWAQSVQFCRLFHHHHHLPHHHRLHLQTGMTALLSTTFHSTTCFWVYFFPKRFNSYIGWINITWQHVQNHLVCVSYVLLQRSWIFLRNYVERHGKNGLIGFELIKNKPTSTIIAKPTLSLSF